MTADLVDDPVQAWLDAADQLDVDALHLQAEAIECAKRAAKYRALAAAYTRQQEEAS